jgi:DNA-binding protein H-NS
MVESAKWVYPFPQLNSTWKADNMPTRKSGSTLSEINTQIAALQAQAEAVRKIEVAAVIAKIKASISRYDLSAMDLGLGPSTRSSTKVPAAGGGKTRSGVRKKIGVKPSTRAVKFRDTQGNTWGGMGKRPAWFKAALASGKTPDDLLAKP